MISARHWVQVVILDPVGQVVSTRQLEDDWYATHLDGSPEQRAAARTAMAGAELEEWLAAAAPSAPLGAYRIVVSEYDPHRQTVGRRWAKASRTKSTSTGRPADQGRRAG